MLVLVPLCAASNALTLMRAIRVPHTPLRVTGDYRILTGGLMYATTMPGIRRPHGRPGQNGTPDDARRAYRARRRIVRYGCCMRRCARKPSPKVLVGVPAQSRM